MPLIVGGGGVALRSVRVRVGVRVRNGVRVGVGVGVRVRVGGVVLWR